MHDVASGWFVPTDSDLANGLEFGFGLTTNIINGGYECGNPWSENEKSLYRIKTFKKMLEFFGLEPEDEDSMGCRDQPRGD